MAARLGAATFKWSRDNASVASGVSAIEGDLTLTVDRAIWDSVRRFSPGDWVEITDDWREFSGAPGEIRQIDSVEDSSRTITLKTALTAGLFPVDGQNLTDPERHTRIKRWDQDSGRTGSDRGSRASGTPFILEDGVEVTFTTEPDGGAFRSGDYWIFRGAHRGCLGRRARSGPAARSAPSLLPARHHYVAGSGDRLPHFLAAIVWRRRRELRLHDLRHRGATQQGTFTIQQAVNQLLKTGGTVCLGPGIFNLAEKPVQLSGAFAVRIRGQGAATVIIQPRAMPHSLFSQAQWCTLDYLTIHTIASTTLGPAIRLSNSIGTTIERIIVSPPAEGSGPLAGVLLEAGFLLLTKIRDNFFRAQSGVTFASKSSDDGALFLGSFYCEHNLLQCSDTGIQLGGSSYYTSDTVIARNFIFGTGVAGISMTGFAFPELEITGNTITPEKGDGIVVGTGGVRIADNRIVNIAGETQNGIRLVTGLLALALTPIVVSGNRLQGLQANGIAIETLLVSAKIEHNVLNVITGNGLIMLPGSAAGA